MRDSYSTLAGCSMRFKILKEALVREAYSRLFSSFTPFYTINEYPKSGGTWVGQMVSSALNIPFPRNCMPKYESSIMHGHHLHPFGMRNVLCVWRDGRDVMVSWYYHCLFKNERSNGRLVDLVRHDLRFDDYSDIEKNLPEFIEYSSSSRGHPGFSWSDFVRVWHGRNNVTHVRYEDLLVNTSVELKRIVKGLCGVELCDRRADEIVEAHSFARMSGRNSGEEKKNSFMRKGIAGDWRNHFSPEARALFSELAGDELVLLGYEKDRSWVA